MNSINAYLRFKRFKVLTLNAHWIQQIKPESHLYLFTRTFTTSVQSRFYKVTYIIYEFSNVNPRFLHILLVFIILIYFLKIHIIPVSGLSGKGHSKEMYGVRHQSRNVTVPRGGTARLHCTINNVEEDGVSFSGLEQFNETTIDQHKLKK